MPRYFLELSYKGTAYSGFQTQQNANTVQAEVEKAFEILQKEKIVFTGSSRTDAGVHALQNYFHFDYNGILHPQFVYKLNAILPADIVIQKVFPVEPEAHCRFDAVRREYEYHLYRYKDPFLQDRAFYFPYKLDKELLAKAASNLIGRFDFAAFSKKRTQVKNFTCHVMESYWTEEQNGLVYHVQADRFLRGMVKAMVGTMLQVGRHRLDLEQFQSVILNKDSSKANFAVPGKGLFLTRVSFLFNLIDAT